MTTFTGYAPGSLVRWVNPLNNMIIYGTVIESDEHMTLVRCDFTGWIETSRLELIR